MSIPATEPWFHREDGRLDQLLTVVGVEDGIPIFEDISENLDQRQEHLNRTTNVYGVDIDNDGRTDLVVTSPTGASNDLIHPEMRILLNRGNLGFEEADRGVFPVMIASVGAASVFDSDNDGDWDLFLGSSFDHLVLLKKFLEKYDFGDGYVSENDASQVLSRLGEHGLAIAEDINEDGVVDARDLSLVLRYQTSTRADNSTLIPQCTPGGLK